MARQRTGSSPSALVALAVLVVAAVGGTGIAATAAAAASPAPTVRLAGVPSLPHGAAVLGPTSGVQQITVDVVLQPRDPSALSAFVAGVSTPGSPRYRHYLAPGTFASTFGPDPGAIAAVRDWLASDGLRVGATSRDGLIVPVTGTADRMAGAFGVSLVDAHLPSGRVARFSEQSPSVPTSVATVVQGVVGLSTVAAAQPQLVPKPAAAPAVPSAPAPAPHAGPVACPQAAQAAQASGGYTADQLAAAYGLSTLYGLGDLGAGQTIGLYELEPFTASDVAAYQSCYGISNPITTVPVDGGATGSQQGEAALDIEAAAGLAPSAAIRVFSGPAGSATAALDTYSAMVTDPTVKVISTSWGLCEPEMAAAPGQQAAESLLFAEAAAVGKTVVAASGDSGSTDCYVPFLDSNTSISVDDPADQPDVTGVGGTTLVSPGPPPVETVWDNFTGSGGGGVSSDFAAPAWQIGPGVGSPPADAQCAALGRSSCREVPDVSASSDPLRGDAVFFNGGWKIIGGTSAAAPLVAAMVALIDQGLGAAVGFVNPALYGAGSCSASPFNDVTTGSNAYLPASGGRYPATPDFDLASGWGSPSAGALLLDLALRPACPVVTGVRPAKGAPGGGNTVVVTGFDLSGVTSVDFGPSPARSFTVTAPGSLTARVPSGPANGAVVDVTLSNASGTSRPVPADRYTYAEPGYWLVASDGGIFTFGATGFYGSTGAIHLNQPIVGMASTRDDQGYWLVASDGGIFTFGDAGFYGSTGAIHLNQPIVGMAPTPSGGGYWLVASDGGIFTFGDAGFYGSTGAIRLNRPVVGMAAP